MLEMLEMSRELDHRPVALREQMGRPGINQAMPPTLGSLQQRTGALLLWLVRTLREKQAQPPSSTAQDRGTLNYGLI